MNIIKFPKKPKKNSLPPEPSLPPLLEEMIDKLYPETFESINLNDINPFLFKRMLEVFPCFKNYKGDKDPAQLFYTLENDYQLTDSQELALLAIFELTTQTELGFSLSETNDIWNEEDQEGFIKVLTLLKDSKSSSIRS